MATFRWPADPWIAGGLALLAVLSAGAVRLYRTAPQSVEDARSRILVAARPSAFTPRFARARERLTAARAAAAAGDDSLAATAYAEAAEHGWAARALAADAAETQAAMQVWASAMLAHAALLREAGTGRGLRRDDNELLRQALALVERVLGVATPPELRQLAQAERDALERKLRPRPLEWLPLPR